MNDVALELLAARPNRRGYCGETAACQAFVVSMDVRRSTELMLKAKEPWLFADFILTLAAALRRVVLQNFGIFDKFTGDGILALFPDFYSGDDAGYYALKTAAECHETFRSHYAGSRSCFNSVRKQAGLGIGIDCGAVEVVHLDGGLTAVGAPVVYACRLAAAPAGKTFVNQPAQDELVRRYGSSYASIETEIDLKGEGPTLAYEAMMDVGLLQPSRPAWTLELIHSTSTELLGVSK